MRSRIFAVALLLAWASTGHAQAPKTGDVLTLVIGQTQVLPAGGVRDVAIGDATVADVKASGDRILITGLRRGSTNLTLLGAGGRTEHLIRVFAEDPQMLARDVKALLEGTEGVKLRVVGDRVVLSGEIYREVDARRIALIRELYPQVLSLAEFKTIAIDRMVQLDVKLMEVSHKALASVGIGWPGSLPLQGTGSLNAPVDLGVGSVGPWTGSLSVITNFGPTLQFMLESDVARILANPVLLAKNGTEAMFQSGGELPIPVNQGLGQTTVVWKDFGIILKFLPRVDPYGNVLLQIDAESSDLDFAQGVDLGGLSVPSLVTRRTRNEVNLTIGETLILAELVSSRNAKSVSKIPGLGHIPILGELFKSRSFRDEDSRFLVFITPRIVKPGDSTDEQIRKQLKAYEDAEDDLDAGILD